MEPGKSVLLSEMKARWLTLVAALGFALAISGQALAKPPEEEAIDRAEKAAERATKAAERAAEATERAAEREARDQADKAAREAKDAIDLQHKTETVSLKTDGSSSSEGGSNQSGSTEGGDASSTSGGSGDDLSDLTAPESGSSGGSGDGSNTSGSDFGTSGSGTSGSSESGDGSNTSGSNSGSSGSSGSGDDDDDGDDDDNKSRDQKLGIIPIESDAAGNPFREGELVVMSDDAELVSRAESLGFGVIEQRPLESIGAVVARLRRPEGVTTDRALELLRTTEPGSASGYNYLYRATGKPPEVKRQEEPIPRARLKNKTVSIGVIDGFASDTIGNWKVERLIDNPAMAGHGDAVAGILLRDLANAYSAEPDRLMLLDVMRGQAGAGAADVAALVFAFDRLVTARVSVANLSLAGPNHPALQRAVSQSQKSGMVVVAAVGNEGPAAPPAFPAAYDGVIGVAAVDGAGKPYLYSGRGPQVDIAALGVEVSSSVNGGELVGTSYAAPHVTAMIAGEKQRRPGSIDTLLTAFAEDAGEPGRDPVYGLGILALDKPERLAQAAAQASN